MNKRPNSSLHLACPFTTTSPSLTHASPPTSSADTTCPPLLNDNSDKEVSRQVEKVQNNHFFPYLSPSGPVVPALPPLVLSPPLTCTLDHRHMHSLPSLVKDN